MAIELTMPKFGLTMHEGTLQRCFCAAGDKIKAGTPLFEVETEKVMYEVEAPASGTLALWAHEEGAVIECGGLVAVIAEANENAAEVASRYKQPQPSRMHADGASARASEFRGTPLAESTHGLASESYSAASASAAAGNRIAVSPVARKLATELGIDLAHVTGSGPNGRITREDVERAAKAPAHAGPNHPARASANGVNASGAKAAAATSGSIPFRGMRRTIATRMHQSLRDTAQLTITTEADVTAASEMRERLKREFDFTFTDMLIHAASRALMRHPRMNSRAAEDHIELLPIAHVGMAVALEEGLIVPVVHDASAKSLREIAAITKDLGERARAAKLQLDDVSGGTFTITNLGTWGIDGFTPILNTGESGILGVGRIVEKPAIYRGEITRRSLLTLSLTFDHRVIDGAPAAAFLQTLIEIFNYGDR
jgi:pyruvate dehydrogenase E2 component (dihydrolipoamide acetyltransferase)